MKKIPYGRYTKELREEAVRMVIENGLSAGEAASRLSLPKSTMENWIKAARAGKLGDIDKTRRPLTEVELELARVKRELAITKMERDIRVLCQGVAVRYEMVKEMRPTYPAPLSLMSIPISTPTPTPRKTMKGKRPRLPGYRPGIHNRP